jgi:hypothetical protein
MKNQIVNVFQFFQCANVFNYANLFEHFRVFKSQIDRAIWEGGTQTLPIY